ncbi:MAG: monooxygenase [Halothiobacillaceae bacterium]|nr:monooxygenase [Halothiobacillaceae bacterium]
MQLYNLPQKLTTEELAEVAKVVPQSIRAAVCRKGHWLGLRPVKLANRRLLWDAEQVAAVLNGEVAS